MEQARLVRQALSVALDRDLMNESVVSGLGWPAYLPYFDTHAPEWDNKWNVQYDPEKAGQLLDQAGFPMKSDNTRFTIQLYGFEYSRAVPSGIADAAAGMWEDIGVKVEVFHYDYAIFRPSVVGRTAVMPWVEFDGSGSLTNHPWDWPRGNQASALSRGGKSHAVELPQATSAYLAAAAEPDHDKRVEINNEFADFLADSQVGVGTIAAGNYLVYNPNKIASWDMEPGIRQQYNSPENIVLK
jgi:peptide/nickel transport system substrate-binding protein